jgi:integrase
MSTLKLKLDKRTPKKDGTYPVSLYVYSNGKPSFISLGSYLTEKEYKDIFEKTPTGKRLEYKRSFEEFLNKSIDIFKTIKPFDVDTFKSKLFQKENEVKRSTGLMAEYFDEFISTNSERLKIKTKTGYKTSKNNFLKYKSDLSIEEITPSFLVLFENWYNSSHPTANNSSANIHLRNLRTVINWLKDTEKLPDNFKYPFGKNKFSIKSIIKPKVTLTADEISALINLDDFNSTMERKSRDLWLMQFYCNGVNLNDIIRLRWDNKIGNSFVIQREKTKSTLTQNQVLIRIPITSKLQNIIDRIGNKNSPFVLGFLKEGMSESQILEKVRKVGKLMNPNLKEIGKRLNFFIELLSETSRDAYATTLKRSGRSIEEIAEMLGHSSITCTRHYLSQFEEEHIHSINDVLP